MSKRIYLVTRGPGEPGRLVRAFSQAQAIRHVAASLYSATVAKQETIVAMMSAGGRVEDASGPDAIERDVTRPDFAG